MEWPKTFNELTGIKNPTIGYNTIQVFFFIFSFFFSEINNKRGPLRRRFLFKKVINILYYLIIMCCCKIQIFENFDGTYGCWKKHGKCNGFYWFR